MQDKPQVAGGSRFRTGRQAGSNFDYGGPLTQVALLGLIAVGMGLWAQCLWG